MNVMNFREEIQRIKANNPDISHREAFSTAAKNVNIYNLQLLFILIIYFKLFNFFFITIYLYVF